jgi:pyridoxal phosphate enzyme, yggS family
MTERQLIENNLNTINQNIMKALEKRGGEVTLLAATKTVSPENINTAIELGVKYIGENRVQEFLKKNDLVDQSAHRHFIGHLQTNKVKDIVGKVELIHSVDSVRLAKEIAKQSLKLNIKSEILLEVNIAGEQSKSGFSPEELSDVLEEICSFNGILVKGLMAIPPICEKSEQNRKYFSKMYKLFIDNKGKKMDNSNMVYLSMGMSDDYVTAIEEGANIIRIGTALFGKRNYNI